jgi:UDP-N-acetylglucosamine--N-acetylmuramyl-(pentapeptide) pyrophosphoryl-undecaprenol N-acetylglucosamine transferase
MPLQKVMIAAGGTGGHIYPALAIAHALKKADAKIEIVFVGTKHGLENKIVPAAGFRVLHVPIGRLNSNVSVVERLTTVLKLPFAFLKSISLLFKYKPDLVLGCGGHASGPVLLMAALLGKRTVIFEPNAMPGMANRWLSRFVGECIVVFEESKAHLLCKKFFRAGMPVRAEMENIVEHAAGSRMHIFSFGGSQGSRGLNTAVCETMMAGGAWTESVELVQQTGPSELLRVQELYGPLLHKLPVEVKDYIHDMDKRYAWADVVIARSGTGTLSELAATGKPSILIPLASAADNHQQKNAEQFVKLGAAIMILQKDLTGVALRQTLKDLWADPGKLKEMGRKARSFHQAGASDKIVQHLLESK